MATSFSNGTFLGSFSKYKGILLSVVLFILLDASVMVLNFYTSYQIAEDAQSVNLAGRQRMLSQRMAKSLFSLTAGNETAEEVVRLQKELSESLLIFDQTLNGFLNGGYVQNANKQNVYLKAITGDAGRAPLQQAQQIWLPYKQAVEDYLKAPAPDQTLVPAVALAKQHNLQLLALMNQATVALENTAASKATRLQIIQATGMVLAIINFVFILLHFLRQLRDSDSIIENARKETTDILNTVNEGLMLLDEQLIIGSQHSKNLYTLFNGKTLAGSCFQTLIESMVSAKDAETARNFIELLFDKKIKEKLIKDLNPLSLVEVNMAQPEGGYAKKYLRFSFARVVNSTAIAHVLVTVQDETEKVLLEKALEESKKTNESQLELLSSLLHTHPVLLKEFIVNSFDCFTRINNILKKEAKSSSQIQEKGGRIYKEIHGFKGEASSLQLAYFEEQAHAMEDLLETLQNKPHLTGSDYLPVTIQLEKLIAYTHQVESLAEKMAQFAVHLKSEGEAITALKANVTPGFSFNPLLNLVQNLAERTGKQVKFVCSGLQDITLPAAYATHIKQVCIQLLRNAVAHGIELPVERQLSEKPTEGRIDLRIAKISNNEMEITVMDDGAGLDYDAIRQKAAATGRWSEEEMECWTKQHVLSLIFHEGISTAGEVNKDAGRGVGMGFVMQQVVQYKGKIVVSSRKGRYCRFTLTLPIQPEIQALAA